VGVVQSRDNFKSDLISKKFISDAWLDRFKTQFVRRFPKVKNIKSNQTVLNLIQNFKKQKGCSKFSWYLESIVKDVHTELAKQKSLTKLIKKNIYLENCELYHKYVNFLRCIIRKQNSNSII